jgi:hypothetical protein
MENGFAEQRLLTFRPSPPALSPEYWGEGGRLHRITTPFSGCDDTLIVSTSIQML